MTSGIERLNPRYRYIIAKKNLSYFLYRVTECPLEGTLDLSGLNLLLILVCRK